MTGLRQLLVQTIASTTFLWFSLAHRPILRKIPSCRQDRLNKLKAEELAELEGGADGADDEALEQPEKRRRCKGKTDALSRNGDDLMV